MIALLIPLAGLIVMGIEVVFVIGFNVIADRVTKKERTQ